MKINLVSILLWGLAGLLLAGCGGQSESKTSAERLPWTRVEQVEVTSDTDPPQQSPTVEGERIRTMSVGPGASQSEVIQAWGVPDYIMDTQSDPERKIWQYSHAVVVFQGTRVEEVLPR